MQVHCPHDRLVPIAELQPNPKNMNRHGEDQILRLAKILEYQGWRYPVKVSKRSGFVTSGHGRIEAAKVLGWTDVPVSFQDYSDETQEYSDVVSDNAIASWAELDLSMINGEIPDLGPDFDLDLLGIKDFSLDLFEKTDSEDPYTKKIEAPIYTPKGDRPALSDLYDLTKTAQLLEQIEESEIHEDVKSFLRLAAQRHTVINFERVAEYYAHAPAEVQELMENSALVIIDFDKAIENGFVALTKEIADLYPENFDE